MGVRGLTTYISDNAKLYLKPYELCDSYLVVDGHNVCCNLYKWVSEGNSAFGGDYDEYYSTVHKFFSMLKLCNVTPIVLFDGGTPREKLPTVLRRADERMIALKGFVKGFSKYKAFPMLNKLVFCDVMEDMKILCIQCDNEADVEIAAVARALNCPVLSYDSDFFIYDVLFIPFSSVYIKPVPFDNSNKFYVRCSIYNISNFLSHFEGLDKSVLPLVVTLLGNDRINDNIYQSFFDNIDMPKCKNKSFTQRKIHGVFQRLKDESLESATQLVANHLPPKYTTKFLHSVKECQKDYSKGTVSESVGRALKTVAKDLDLTVKPFKWKWPSVMQKLYSKCRIHRSVVDMISLKLYLTFQQVECTYAKSSHFAAIELISYIYALLPNKEPSKILKLYLTIGNRYCGVNLKNTTNPVLKDVNLSDLLKESPETRLRFLCCVLGVDANDLEIVPTSDWSVFILSTIYWIRQLNSDISLAHIQALVLMVIANAIVQKSVGYYSSEEKLMKGKKKSFDKYKDEKVVLGQGKDFKQILENITHHEKLFTQIDLMPYRKLIQPAIDRGYSIVTTHLYSAFQSVLFHIMYLNSLLNYPLPHLKVSDFFSGTLLFNFYVFICDKGGGEKLANNLFKNAPNLKAMYSYLSETLCDYSDKTAVVEVTQTTKKKKRKKKGKKIGEVIDEGLIMGDHIEDEVEEGEDYDDDNNPYAILQRAAGRK